MSVRRGLGGLVILAILVLAGIEGADWLRPGTWMSLETTLSHLLSAEAKPAPDYQLAKVEIGPIASQVRATGTLKPEVTALVASAIVGRVKEILVGFNTPVKAGEVVARLDADQVTARLSLALADLDVGKAAAVVQQAEIERARSDSENMRQTALAAADGIEHAKISLDDADRELKRKQGLATTGDTPREQRDQAETAAASARAALDTATAQAAAAQAAYAASQSALKAAEAQADATNADIRRREAAVAQARVDVAETEIHSPIDGTIIARNIEIGEVVAAGPQAPALFVVAADLRQMLVQASIDEADIGGVAAGQAVSFTVDAHPGEAFAGRIVDVHVSPDTVQNVVTYTAVIAAANPALKLLPGMTANVRITVESADAALKVPNAALRFLPDGIGAKAADTATQVWVLGGNGKPRSVAVRTGISDGVYTEIIGGDLQAGQRVIVGVARAGASVVHANGSAS